MPKLSKYKLSTRLNLQVKYKSLKQMYKALSTSYHPYLTLTRISVKPRKKLCDFTGLPTHYMCPRTFLRYYDLSVYKYMISLPSEISENFYDNKMYGMNMLNNKK